MNRLAGIALLLIGSATFALAVPLPEIDPGTAGSALVLLAGAALVIRGRRRS